MSGILEQMKAQLDANTAEIAALKQHIASMGAAQAAPAPAAANPFGGFGAPAPAAAPLAAAPAPAPAPAAAPANVTGEAITALIQPYVENVQVKEALGAEMRAMGINALPETQPHQYAEMYQRFSAVIARFQAGAAAAPAAAPAASII